MLTAKRFGLSGLVGTLGEPTITVSREAVEAKGADIGLPVRSDGSFFQRIGFDDMESLDISEFEDCTHIHDLNSDSIPNHLRSRFDFVFNGGTIEHVFHVPNALRNVFEMLKPGGSVTHGGPVNGWVDHGFYQFSPTLFLDYYFANGFEILEAEIVETDKADPELWRIAPYYPGSLDRIGTTETRALRWNIYFTARKTAKSTAHIIPQQSYYTSIYGDPAAVALAPRLEKFEPYWLRCGQPADDPLRSGKSDAWSMARLKRRLRL